MIRAVRPEDSSAICRIYNHYIETSIATFEEVPLTSETMAARITEISAAYPWLCWVAEDQVSGYAYASQWKSRSAYKFTAETTVYVAPDSHGQGIGAALYQKLITALREMGMHTVLAGISLPNPGSVALHEKAGFRKAAHFHQVGWKFDQWIDVAYWELFLQEM